MQPKSTVTVAETPVIEAVQPAVDVALVIEYVVVDEGDTVTIFVPEGVIVSVAELPPVHEYATTSPDVPVNVSVVLVPISIVVVPDIEGVGSGLIVIADVVAVVLPHELVAVSV